MSQEFPDPRVQVEVWVKVGDGPNERMLMGASHTEMVPLPRDTQPRPVATKVHELLYGAADQVAQQFATWEADHA